MTGGMDMMAGQVDFDEDDEDVDDDYILCRCIMYL